MKTRPHPHKHMVKHHTQVDLPRKAVMTLSVPDFCLQCGRAAPVVVKVEGAGHLPVQHRPVDLHDPEVRADLRQHQKGLKPAPADSFHVHIDLIAPVMRGCAVYRPM